MASRVGALRCGRVEKYRCGGALEGDVVVRLDDFQGI